MKSIFYFFVLQSLFATQIFAQNTINTLLADLNKAKTPSERINILERLGFSYQQQNAHKKAIE